MRRVLALALAGACIACGPTPAPGSSQQSSTAADQYRPGDHQAGVSDLAQPSAGVASKHQGGAALGSQTQTFSIQPFDFYVLALSWSPTYCAEEQGEADERQCAPGRRYSFIVHGLWPQTETGPTSCNREERGRRLERSEVERMLDIMPAPGLVRHQWNKHAQCFGFTARDYFDKTRAAREAIAIPNDFAAPSKPLETSPQAVEAAFRSANPGLRDDAIAVTCRRGRIGEVRVCFDKELRFRACPVVDRRGCRDARATMPPVR